MPFRQTGLALEFCCQPSLLLWRYTVFNDRKWKPSMPWDSQWSRWNLVLCNTVSVLKKEWKEWLWLSRGLKKTCTCSFHVAVPSYWFLSNSHIIYLLIENEANMQVYQHKCFFVSSFSLLQNELSEKMISGTQEDKWSDKINHFEFCA